MIYIVLPFLVICKEGIGDPYFFGKVSGKREHFVLLRAERQPLVLPVLVQVHRYCVILKKKKHTFNNNIFSSAIISNMSYHKFPTNDILKTKLWKNCYFVLKTHHANFWYWIKTCYCQVKPYIQGVSWKKEKNIRIKTNYFRTILLTRPTFGIAHPGPLASWETRDLTNGSASLTFFSNKKCWMFFSWMQ